MLVIRRAAAPTFIAVALGALGACAKIEAPPGGPPDVTPPRVVAISPEALAVLPGFDGDVEFRFSEVISEGGVANEGTGSGDLERLVVLSPTTRVPEVRWRRNRITVRPREGWQPNRVYRVELLSGVSDLRNNRATDGRDRAVVTFTTGAPVPAATIRGTIFDWTTARPAPAALIEALMLPDSLSYKFVSDSTGAFALGPLPAGTYLVYGILDANRDHRRDTREPFDSSRIATTATTAATRLELWTYPHDTVGPRIRDITIRDSVTAQLTLTQPLDPAQPLLPAAVSIRRLPDSTAVPVVSLAQDTPELVPPVVPGADSLAPRDSARVAPRDSARVAPRDTGRKVAPGRPPLNDRLIVRVGAPWTPGSRYVLTLRGIRNVNGVAADAAGTIAPPAAVQRGDSVRARPDSVVAPKRVK